MALVIPQCTNEKLITILLMLNGIMMLTYVYQDKLLYDSNVNILKERKTLTRSTNAFQSQGGRSSDAIEEQLWRNASPSRRYKSPNITNIPYTIDEGDAGYYNLRNNEALRFHCGHCAVVTNSGHLLNSSAGSRIDSTECVLRMNAAPTIGFEEDVGKRTTIRVIGHANIGKTQILESEEPKMVVIPWLYVTNIDREKNVYFNIAKNLSVNHTGVEFYLFSEDKVNISEQIFKEETGINIWKEAHNWLSTGWMTMIFALDVCDRIDVYGIVPGDYCSKLTNWTTPYHYYDPKFRSECGYYNASETRLIGGHKFITEKAIYAKWYQKYNLNFYHPTWDAEDLETSNNRTNSTFLNTPYLRRYQRAMETGEMKEALLALEKKKHKVQRILKTREILRKRKEARLLRARRRIQLVKARKRNAAPKSVNSPEKNSTLQEGNDQKNNQSKGNILRKFRNINTAR
ncbi:alpha-N-acetylgalactosaminide alpha-2,6-sialyltransferase 5-like [Anneissia japonica]|uniref:alpha-N-acetylgalactosaminide alpha-2,6-sialyltransferase 5-like n=1 Tax=Anneissia japonica TaxID=1529436 RepID=UPI0014259FC6|nr:alpha-N-acetylgalactosaminide alpha-2,6-sialyltransferase 5-like [Anneissia japonica]